MVPDQFPAPGTELGEIWVVSPNDGIVQLYGEVSESIEFFIRKICRCRTRVLQQK